MLKSIKLKITLKQRAKDPAWEVTHCLLQTRPKWRLPPPLNQRRIRRNSKDLDRNQKLDSFQKCWSNRCSWLADTRHIQMNSWCKSRPALQTQVRGWNNLQNVFLISELCYNVKFDYSPATGFDLYLLRVSVVEALPDSVVLKEPATMVEADVVV